MKYGIQLILILFLTTKGFSQTNYYNGSVMFFSGEQYINYSIELDKASSASEVYGLGIK